MKSFFPALLIIFSPSLFSQNLVQNPSFEDTVSCPDFVSQIDRATGWITSVNTPDYYHSCNNTSQTNPGMVGVPNSARGYQPARTGNAMAGIVTYYTAQTNYREMFYRQLSTPLSAGVNYSVGMYIVLNEDNAQWAVDGGIGLYLSSAPINPMTPFAYTPQVMNPLTNVLNDSLNWTMISGIVTATGGEQYITIGGFIPDNQLTIVNRGGTYPFTSYAIEDVWVIPESLLTADPVLAMDRMECYPNPSTGIFHFNTISPNPLTFEVIDVSGRLVYQGMTAEDRMDLTCLPDGLFTLRVISGEFTDAIRIQICK